VRSGQTYGELSGHDFNHPDTPLNLHVAVRVPPS
jgi:hypothetical protein